MKLVELFSFNTIKRANTIQQGFFDGTYQSLSVSMAGGLFGFVFGAIAVSQGLNLWQTVFMSAGMYAGMAQVISLPIILKTPDAFLLLSLTTLVTCMRYFLMGISIHHYLRNISSKVKKYIPFSLFLLMDENWALTAIAAKKENNDDEETSNYLFGYFCGSGILAYILWVLGTYLGTIFSNNFSTFNSLGIDFAFLALFIALLAFSWRGKCDIAPWIVSALLAIIGKFLMTGTLYIVIAAVIGSCVGAYIKHER
jgi:4-azaleucine resistance transporter AzlC